MAEIMAGNKSRDCLTDSRASELSGAASLGVNGQLLLVFVTGRLSCGIQFPVQKRHMLVCKRKHKMFPWTLDMFMSVNQI